jgi:hypothetical protein
MNPGDIHQAMDASTGSENPRSVYSTLSSAGGRSKTIVSSARISGTTATEDPARAADGQTSGGSVIADNPVPVGVTVPVPEFPVSVEESSTVMRIAIQSRAIHKGTDAEILFSGCMGDTVLEWLRVRSNKCMGVEASHVIVSNKFQKIYLIMISIFYT